MLEAGVPDWVTVRTIDIATPIPGSTTIGPFGSNLVADDYRVSGVPVVFVRDIREDGFEWRSGIYVDTAKAAELRAHSVEPGDLVATKMGLPPCIAAEYPYSMPPGIITADIIRLRPDVRKTDVRWLMRAINSRSVQAQVRAITGGITRPKVTLRDFRELQLNLPSLAEQQRIAEVLDTLDEAIRKSEQLIAKLKQLKQGLLRDLLTRGISDNGELRDPACSPKQFRDSPLGVIPNHWATITLSSVATLSSGTTPSRSQSRYWTNGTTPWVKTAEVNFTPIHATEETVTELALSETPLRLYPPGTVLVAMYGQGTTRGRSAILSAAATTNQACAAIQPNLSKLTPQFLFAYLKAQYEQLRGLGHGSNQTNLSVALLGRFPLVLPPLSEQLALVAVLDAHDACAAEEERAVQKLSLLKRGLTEDLLTGRVRVTNLLKEVTA